MKEENTQKLYEIAPYLFRYKENGGWYGFECGDGWFDIICVLLKQLEKIALDLELRKTDRVFDDPEEAEEFFSSEYFLEQIKEKYGTLRIYMNRSTDEMNEAIKEAEALSSLTCEACGKSGKINEEGHWKRCRCEKCQE